MVNVKVNIWEPHIAEWMCMLYNKINSLRTTTVILVFSQRQ
jgi:hypothetical protein